ncbi:MULTISPECIES: ABC transporter ATP-binding protein [Paenibacillus]|uniref:ABC transporter ATP-binding protein n=1 Tax=Paenibacillus TaxID=44249 RepID=UPI001C8E7898|nr:MULTISPECIES: ABC transporter ATP-binding protein [Paenibacillus]MBY0012901.1 ABC transporter ATP-binding protein [Paenibacillus typhae]MDF9843899.1 ABC-2 type transport system ATP-binding protein [Paenibacillus sp. PastF-2]MDF9850504.1 ABC-2 type transport system ATP-binding protein [Paenibacillus sp. PastM-2]MDF9856230.1 ABC-2 type transport system ATP-binding protein [Paenibacillus sp. PastF-1]MDH6481541.1 ABC-2 type transport system ATP-binding protein [Paenibacillus sp. PastH-2]
MRTIFSGEAIDFSYNKKEPVLDGLSISITDRQIYGLLGPNGAGKSTLTKVMLGLENPQKGKLQWFNEYPNQSTKSRVGYVPQDLALIYDLSAYENVEFFGKLYNLKGEKLKKQVRYALEFVGLWEERKQKPKKFSGGMKRRLNIACGIVHNPDVIILDEPTVGVDPQSRNRILDAILELNQLGTTIVYISHYMEEVEKICSHVGIIDNGTLLCEGRLSDILEAYTDQAILKLELQQKSSAYTARLADYTVVAIEDNKIELAVPKNNVGVISEIKDRLGDELKSFQYISPNLEQVFFKLTKKNLRD